MKLLKDLLYLRELVKRGEISPREVEEHLASHDGPLKSLSVLFDQLEISASLRNPVFEELASREDWPGHSRWISRLNQRIYHGLQAGNCLTPEEMEAAWDFCQGGLEEEGGNLLNFLIKKEWIRPQEAREIWEIEFNHLLHCPQGHLSLEVEIHYPWLTFLCPLCERDLVPMEKEETRSDRLEVATDAKLPRPALSDRDSTLKTATRHGRSQSSSEVNLANHQSQREEKDRIRGEYDLIKAGKLGKYEIRHKIGQGGMGAVYQAYDPEGDRIVAMKVISSKVDLDEDQLLRFRKEMSVASKLNSPHIVPIFEVGEIDSIPFYTMAYIEGRDLREIVQDREGDGHWKEDLALLEKVARALSHAHQQGIVHRDIKAENILVNQEGEPFITDFGLALELSAEESRLTQTGMILGTPHFMSPEQALGMKDSVGPKSDIYSLGALTYYLLSGKYLFESDDVLVLLNKVAEKAPVRLGRHCPHLPRNVEVVVHKCLEKEPHRRYEKMTDLVKDLQALQEGRPIRARPPGLLERGRRWMASHRTLTTTGVLLFILLLATSGYWFQEHRKSVEKKKEVLLILNSLSSQESSLSREDLVAQVMQHPGPETTKLMIQYLRKGNRLQRLVAIESLGKFGDLETTVEGRDSVDWLVERLKELDAREKKEEAMALIWALGRLKDNRAEEVVAATRNQFSKMTSFWKKTYRPYRLIPLPEREGPLTLKEELSRAWKLFYKQKIEAAGKAFDQVLSQKPHHLQALMGRARINFVRGEPDKSAEDLKKILEIEPRNSEASFYMAMYWKKKDKPRRTLKFLNRAIESDPTQAQFFIERYHIYLKKRMKKEALADLNRLYELNSMDLDTLVERGILHLALKNYGKAVRDFTEVIKADSSRPEAYQYRGRAHLALNNNLPAFEDYNRLTVLKPRSPLGYTGQGVVQMRWGHFKKAIERYNLALEFSNKKAPLYAKRGYCHLKLGQTKKARRDLEKALELDKNLAEGHAHLGQLHYEEGKKDKALQNFNRAEELGFRAVGLYGFRGEILQSRGKYKEAEKDFLKASKLPFHSTFTKKKALYFLGKCQMKLGKRKEARKTFEKLRQIAPDYPPLYNSLALLAIEDKNYSQGEKLFQMALKLDSKYFTATRNLAHLYRDTGKFKKSLALYNSLVENFEPRSMVYNERGNLHLQRGRLDRALRDFEKSLELDPKKATTFSNLSVVFMRKSQLKKALEYSQKALDIDSEHYPAYNNLGVIYLKMKKPSLALQALNKAIELKPQSSRAHGNRGRLWALLGRPKKALADLNRAIKLDNQNYKAWNNRGAIYLKKKALSRAMEDFNRALKANPRYGLAYFHRGIVYYYQGKKELALKEFSLAIDANPSLHQALTSRGVIYLKKGQYKKALKDYNRAIKLRPNRSRFYYSRGIIFLKMEKWKEGQKDFEKILELENSQRYMKKAEEKLKEVRQKIGADSK